MSLITSLPFRTFGLLGILLLSFVLLSPQQSGEFQQFQQGESSCSITPTTPNNVCQSLITFPKPFIAVPNYDDAFWDGSSTAPIRAVITSPVIDFQSDNGETWTGMPAAATELYGNTNHRIQTNLVASTTASASLDCVNTRSLGANAVLRPQFSTDSGSTWTELASVAGSLDIPIGSGSTCAFGAGLISSIGDTTTFTTAIKLGARTGSTWIRFIGIGGTGVGDNPAFNNIRIEFYTVVIEIPSLCTNHTVTPLCTSLGGTDTSKTTMTINAVLPFAPVATVTINFEWQAKLCMAGGNNC